MQEVVIAAGTRTPVGAFGKSLRNVSANELGRQVLEDLMLRTEVTKEEVEEVVFGHGYVHGGGLNSARIATHHAKFPYTVPAHVVIKACGSSLKAITGAATSIMAGQSDVVIAGGVESMSNVPYITKNRWGSKFGNIEMEDALLADGLTCSITHTHMGVTAETLREKHSISREEQDLFALESHQKASHALKNGRFEEETFSISIQSKKGSKEFTKDESIRHEASLDDLAALPPVFQKNGTVTAGNACPMNDGGAALLLMSKEKAEDKGLKPLAKIKSFASTGVHPEVMGIGPVSSTQKALAKAGLQMDEIGLVELNEAFAAQSLAVMKELQLPKEIVNVNGGAIALGHPVGATGAKLSVTLLHEMKRRNVKYGLVTLCMAGGMGITTIYENLHWEEN